MLSLKRWARRLKQDGLALWIAARSPKTPWLPKIVAACVAAYMVSPIDLIPDFIPVLGYVDDLVIVPLGIWLVVRLIPPPLMAEFRAQAMLENDRSGNYRPRNYLAAVAVVAVWLVALALCWTLWRKL